MTQVIVELEPHEYARLELVAAYANVSIATLLKDAAQHYIPDLLAKIPNVTALPDDQVRQLADARMEPDRLDRWRELRDTATARTLTTEERRELQALQEAYWIGQYTKTEAMIEAVQRGLVEAPQT